MSRYCALIAGQIGEGAERVDEIRVASQMHDIGKIGIPDSILLKPGPLTPEERTVMMGHAEIGYRILSGSSSRLMQLAAVIARTHHERVDGRGYPNGLKDGEIPLEGRISAIADVFDALTSDRTYKRGFPLGRAVEIMQEGSGRHFDASILAAFLDSLDLALAIREEHEDD